MLTHIKITLASFVAIAAFCGILYVSIVDYKCLPHIPKNECRLSRYEVRVYDSTTREKRIIGVAEGACVFTIGDGKNMRYVMTDAEFTASNRTDYFDRVEFPAGQSLVCEVR